LKKLNLNWKKKGKGNKKYHSYKIKLDKKSKELKGEIIEHKTNVASIVFDSSFPIIPKTSKIKIESTITNYLNEDDVSEVGVFLVNLKLYIFQIF
jgi:hypothetical protein